MVALSWARRGWLRWRCRGCRSCGARWWMLWLVRLLSAISFSMICIQYTRCQIASIYDVCAFGVPSSGLCNEAPHLSQSDVQWT